MNWQHGVLKESCSVDFDIDFDIDFVGGGEISMDEEGDIDINEWRWIQGVNQYGFDSKLIDPEKAVLGASFTIVNYNADYNLEAGVGVSASFRWNGEWDSELDKWKYGGEYCGLVFTISLCVLN